MSLRIHIGVHKTATTELQFALRQSSDALAAGGLGYLGPWALRRGQLPLHNALRGGDPAAEEEMRAVFGEWFAAHPEHLLSEENIIGTTHRTSLFGPGGQLYPAAADQLSRLLSLMGGVEAEIYMAVRDPADFVTSAYGQQLKTGMPGDMDGYLRGLRVRDLSWAELAGRLLQCDGVKQVICWRYEDHAETRPALLERMLGPELAGEVPRMRWHNGGISQAAYDMLAQLVLADTRTPISELLQRARKEHPRKAGVPPMRLLPPRVHRRSLDAYASDLETLAGMDHVTLLRPPPAGGRVDA